MGEWRSEPCPERGPGLTHSVDHDKRPSGACLECGAVVSVPWGEPRTDPTEHGFAATDNHRAALCANGMHLAPLTHRYGSPDKPTFLCDRDIARIIQQLNRQPHG